MEGKRMVGGFFCALFLAVNIMIAHKYEMAPMSGSVMAQEEEAESKQPDLDLYATAAVLMDADSGRVLYAHNADNAMAMASTTKIMTCILVLEQGDLDDEVTVSSYAAGMPKVKLYVKQGETYLVRDLLFSLMLESHNDSAVVLAEYIGKRNLPEELRNKDTAEFTKEESKQAVLSFASMMNQKAEELGCKDTYFVTPNGLDATHTVTAQDGTEISTEHHTTAKELATIMCYCIGESPKRDLFLEITRTGQYSFSANGRNFSCSNHNSFLNMMEGALSGKTGFTNKAGYCYVGALERDGKRLVVALLACGWPNHKSYKWSDTKNLMSYGLEHYQYHDFATEREQLVQKCLQPIEIRNARGDYLGQKVYVNVSLDGNYEGLDGLLLREDEKVKVWYRQRDIMEAPVKKGTVVGTVLYLVGEKVCRKEQIVVLGQTERIDGRWCAEEIVKRFLLHKDIKTEN